MHYFITTGREERTHCVSVESHRLEEVRDLGLFAQVYNYLVFQGWQVTKGTTYFSSC